MSEVRTFSGHRMVTDPVTRDDRCLGCGWNGTGSIGACRPDAPRCESCAAEGQDLPADVLEYVGGERFAWCAAHRLGLRRRA